VSSSLDKLALSRCVTMIRVSFMFGMWCWQNFGFTFILGEKKKQDALTIGCKTQDVKAKWIEAIRLAQYVLWSHFSDAADLC